MGDALKQPMVLAMSIWDDHAVNMLWLDSTYPVDKTGPGGPRGPCPTTGGSPAEVEAQFPNSNVVFSNIRFGPINSTVPGLDGSNPGPNPDPTTTSNPVPTPTAGPEAGQYEQCGGNGWTGPTRCRSPWTCNVINEWYHQCL